MMRAKLLGLTALLALTGCGLGGPPQPLFSLAGHVIDDKGQAVPGAVVTDGQVSAITDESGHYTLGVFETAIVVTKPGRATAHFEVAKGDKPETRLGPGNQTVRVGLDTRFGGPGLSGLRAAIGTVATRLDDYPATGLNSLDALVMVTPGSLTEVEVASLGRWLHGGGRLIVCGAWGGFSEQDLATLNALAQPAGITFTGAAVKTAGDTPEMDTWTNVTSITPTSLAKLAGTGTDDHIYMFASTALSLSAPARPMLLGDRKSYAVLGDSSNRVGVQTLAAVGAEGQGKVFALADSAFWKDEDSANSGVPNIQRGANSRLVGALLKW